MQVVNVVIMRVPGASIIGKRVILLSDIINNFAKDNCTLDATIFHICTFTNNLPTWLIGFSLMIKTPKTAVLMTFEVGFWYGRIGSHN